MKRIVSMFVLIAMVTCFFGCGNKNENILTTLSTETDPSSDTSFFSDTNSSEYSSEIGTLSDGSIAPIVNPNSGNSSSGNIDPPNNNSNNTSGKVTNPKNPTNHPSNVKPGEYLGKDKPLMSKLPHELNPAQYHYTMTPADFFTKTGNEYSSTTAILKRFNVAKYYDNKSLNGDDIVTKSELVKLLGVVFDNDPTI